MGLYLSSSSKKRLHNNVIFVRYTYISIWIWKVAFLKKGRPPKMPPPKSTRFNFCQYFFYLWYRSQSQFLEPITTTLRALPRSATAQNEERYRSNFVDDIMTTWSSWWFFLISNFWLVYSFYIICYFIFIETARSISHSTTVEICSDIRNRRVATTNFEFDVISSGVGKILESKHCHTNLLSPTYEIQTICIYYVHWK